MSQLNESSAFGYFYDNKPANQNYSPNSRSSTPISSAFGNGVITYKILPLRTLSVPVIKNAWSALEDQTFKLSQPIIIDKKDGHPDFGKITRLYKDYSGEVYQIEYLSGYDSTIRKVHPMFVSLQDKAHNVPDQPISLMDVIGLQGAGSPVPYYQIAESSELYSRQDFYKMALLEKDEAEKDPIDLLKCDWKWWNELSASLPGFLDQLKIREDLHKIFGVDYKHIAGLTDSDADWTIVYHYLKTQKPTKSMQVGIEYKVKDVQKVDEATFTMYEIDKKKYLLIATIEDNFVLLTKADLRIMPNLG